MSPQLRRLTGKHLPFSDDDIIEIMKAGSRQPVTARQHRPHCGAV
jgi:hypothetical protein